MLGQVFFTLFIFPGVLFLVAFGFAGEYLDRKLYARLQNRVGPPWFQPVADFIKLAGKEDIIPEEANPRMFRVMPIFALASTITAFFYIPAWRVDAYARFDGDLIVVLYLLMIPTLTYFLGGWYSTSLYSKIGAIRAVTQLFAYEVPLLMAVLSPAILADTWSLSRITAFYTAHHWYWLVNTPAFFIALIAMLGKLEKVPFDIPEAETEIVAGTFTEYGGRLLGLFRLNLDVEAVVGGALLAAVFMPFGLTLPPLQSFVVFVLKVALVIAALAVLRTIFARLRIDQMISFCWRHLAPLAFLQILAILVLKVVLR